MLGSNDFSLQKRPKNDLKHKSGKYYETIVASILKSANVHRTYKYFFSMNYIIYLSISSGLKLITASSSSI
ncbi:hypothetical protein BpHYR1_029792 [Brachionus plicatilis]|uniref:Uncharacterized protein n=1 Tax=Brachionus plicatilis TaxID=10195 RepID=A0A3M7RAP6_BRAPC|nr:hypothetical protein BpHYR1_029792 [Brachionus plicatilis]